MLIQMLAIVALCAGTAGADTQEIYGFNHEITSPRDVASTQKLKTALRRFEREIAGKRGHSKARSSKPKEIVVVGSKVKDVVRSSPGFSEVTGLARESDPVEYRRGSPPSLSQLQGAIRRFEGEAGPRSPCVGKCRTAARRCMARCRGRLKKRRIKGQCICAHIQADCLVKAAERNQCYPPDPGRRLRR